MHLFGAIEWLCVQFAQVQLDYNNSLFSESSLFSYFMVNIEVDLRKWEKGVKSGTVGQG